jgi:hypothetical protein
VESSSPQAPLTENRTANRPFGDIQEIGILPPLKIKESPPSLNLPPLKSSLLNFTRHASFAPRCTKDEALGAIQRASGSALNTAANRPDTQPDNMADTEADKKPDKFCHIRLPIPVLSKNLRPYKVDIHEDI